MTIDFSKLKVRGAEELKQADERRYQQAIAEDMAKRQERCRRTITITLTCDAESRYTMGGTRLISFQGNQPDRKPVHTIYYAPDHFGDENFEAAIEQLVEGVCVELKGYWKPFRASSGETHFQFIAQFIDLS